MVGERDNQFYNELKQLNSDFIKYLQETNEKSPFFDFTPTLQDYIRQMADLDKQYPERSPSQIPRLPSQIPQVQGSQVPKLTGFTATAFTPGTNIFTAPQGSLFSAASTGTTSTPSLFSTTSTMPSTTTPTQPFSFGAAVAQTNAPSSAPPQPLFSFSLAQKDGDTTSGKLSTSAANTTSLNPNADTTTNEETAAQDDEEDAPPPDPKLDKYEEPDYKYSTRCKLYEKVKTADSTADVSLNLVGVGKLYVKLMDAPNKLQVILRQEPDFMRVLLNEIVTEDIPVKILPKAVQMVFPSISGETRLVIVKVRDEKEAESLYQVLNSVKD